MKKNECFLACVLLLNSMSVLAQAKPADASTTTRYDFVVVRKLNVPAPPPPPAEAKQSKPTTKVVIKKATPPAKTDKGLKLATELSKPVVKKDAFPMEDILKMQNDKEVVISSFTQEERARVLSRFEPVQTHKEKLKDLFYGVMYKYLNAGDAKCESVFISTLIFELQNYGIAKNETEMRDVFKFLRSTSVIDDVMYDILDALTKDYFALSDLDLKAKPVENPFKNYDKKAKDYDLNLLFQEFKVFPDETNKCAYREFIRLQNGVGEKTDNQSTRNKLLKDLALKAYKDQILTAQTYNMFKFLTGASTANQRSVWLNDYVSTAILAKNKMIPIKSKYKVINLEDENKYTSEKKSRFSKISLRKALYSKYDANQIILLTQIMKKASQRMGVDPDTKSGIPYIVQEFQQLNQAGDRDNYVEKIELDSQSQYNLARRLLRKDMVKLQMMDAFTKSKITYDDVVTASVETGYISLDDVEFVVKYDDLWNPEISKGQKMLNMTFRIAGYSTFFLPPPWNVTGALALSIIEGIVDSKIIDGASNDNANTFIE